MTEPENSSTTVSEREDDHKALILRPEEVAPILVISIEQVLRNQNYNEQQVPHWVDSICDGCMKGLAELQRPFKYVVTCMIMQTNGAGFCVANSAYLDTRGDCVTSVKWPQENATLAKDNEKGTEEKKDPHMVCVVTAAGMVWA